MSNNPSPAEYSPKNSSVYTPELKLYQAFIFSVPICFTFILLFLFYLFYLRRRRVDWSSVRMRTTLRSNDLLEISRVETGLKKEVREMLPIVIYKESFSIRDTQCAVCLGDYQAEDKLQQIPSCGHVFHIDCIDRWLSNHTTCPLCRLSLIAKLPSDRAANEEDDRVVTPNGDDATLGQSVPQASERQARDPQLEESRSVANEHGEERGSCPRNEQECVIRVRETGKGDGKTEKSTGTSDTCHSCTD